MLQFENETGITQRQREHRLRILCAILKYDRFA
jgi:hypothetical protein